MTLSLSESGAILGRTEAFAAATTPAGMPMSAEHATMPATGISTYATTRPAATAITMLIITRSFLLNLASRNADANADIIITTAGSDAIRTVTLSCPGNAV